VDAAPDKMVTSRGGACSGAPVGIGGGLVFVPSIALTGKIAAKKVIPKIPKIVVKPNNNDFFFDCGLFFSFSIFFLNSFKWLCRYVLYFNNPLI